MHYRKSIFTLTSLALSITSAIGQETAALDSVVVTGSRVEAKLEETPQRIEVIDQDDIERTPAQNLTDLLKKNSSVDVIEYPGNLSGVGIRGYRPEYSGINKHSLLLIDGRPAMSTNLSIVNRDQIERIEVLKGPASALYGSSAMGGVINLITRESRGALGGYGEVSYGSYSTKEVKAGAGGAINEVLDFDYNGSYFDQANDFKAGNGDTRDNTAYSQQSHALRLGVNFNQDWRLNVKSDVYRGRDIASPGSVADGLNSQSNKDMDRNGTDIALTGKMGDHRLTLRTFVGEESYTTYKKTSTTAADLPYLPYRSYYSDTQWNGAQVQDAWAWSDTANLVYGIDYEKAKVTTRSYTNKGAQTAPYSANNDRETTGFYAQNTWYFNDNNSTFYVGARRDQVSVSTLDTPLKTNFTPSTSDFDNTSPSAGFKHLLGAGFRLHGTIGKGFMVPDASYMTGTATSVSGKTTTITQGNSSLKPETSVTYDLGLEWSNSDFYTDLTVFHTKVDDKIANSITTISNVKGYKTNLSTYYNASEAIMRGIEWEGRWKATRNITLSLAGTHYFERSEQNGDSWTDIRNVPENTIRASIDAEYGPWSGRLGVRQVGKWYDNNWTGDTSQIITYDGFTTADFWLRYRVDKKQSVMASIDNLTDRYYEEKGGYPLPGRNGKLSYRYEF